MKTLRNISLFFFCTLFSVLILGQSNYNITPFERKVFIENKGQFSEYKESYDKLEKEGVKYAIDKDYKTFFYSDKIAYLFSAVKFLDKHKPEGKGKPKEERRIVTKQLIEIEWLGANNDVEIISSNKVNARYTYAGQNQKGKSIYYDCDGFKKITYKNLYNNIDIEYTFHPESGIKYNLILHPDANINDVKIKYSGANLELIDGEIVISTINGEMKEKVPTTFYSNDKNLIIESNYSLENNILSFKLDSYNSNKTVIIDPWVTVPSASPKAYDNGVDNSGNIYVYGATKVVEKYNVTGSLIWSLSPAINTAYYGDLLVEPSGNFYLCEGFVSSGARTHKFDPTSALIWTSTFNGSFREHWRLALNCVTQKVIVAGGGTTSPTLNIAEIDVNTGSLINAKSVYNGSQSDVAGLAVDQLGKSYLKHSNPNIVTFTDNANNTLANVNDGYGYSEVGSSYYPNLYANGHSMMALGGGNLFTSDGVTIHKWDITTHAIIATTTIPGSARMASGLIADDCDNLFVGGTNGVYRFDFNLNQLEFQPTSAAVYDIAFSATNADIITCGSGFLTNLPFGRISCASANKTIVIDSCETSINTVTITPLIGLAPFTFLWNDGNTTSSRTDLPPGTYTVTIKDASCVPSFIFDTVIIPPKLYIGDFTNDTVCLNLPTQFNGTIAQTPGTNTWNWDFGDGNSSTIQTHPTPILLQELTLQLLSLLTIEVVKIL